MKIERSVEIDQYDGRTIIGRAVTFDKPYTVADQNGRYTETYSTSSFDRSLAHKAERPLMVSHERTALPVGVVKFAKSGDHLAFEATIARSQKGDEILELVTMGALDNVSIGAVGIAPRTVERGRIHRTEVAIRELSLVTFGALDDAKVLALRQEQDEDLERLQLRYRILKMGL